VREPGDRRPPEDVLAGLDVPAIGQAARRPRRAFGPRNDGQLPFAGAGFRQGRRAIGAFPLDPPLRHGRRLTFGIPGLLLRIIRRGVHSSTSGQHDPGALVESAMRIAMFDTHAYEREAFETANAALRARPDAFFEPRLTADTASVAAGFPAVCAFVNDRLDRAGAQASETVARA
jgi:hypothetical protein